MRNTLLITLVILFSPLFSTGAEPPASQAKHIKIVLVGDSTVQESSGWGPGFIKLLDPQVKCINAARGGRSSKSFINEGHWKKVLKVPLIDLYQKSLELCNKLGLEGSKEFDAPRKAKPGDPPGARDSTHLNAKGADVFGKIVAEELKKVAPELAPHIRD